MLASGSSIVPLLLGITARLLGVARTRLRSSSGGQLKRSASSLTGITGSSCFALLIDVPSRQAQRRRPLTRGHAQARGHAFEHAPGRPRRLSILDVEGREREAAAGATTFKRGDEFPAQVPRVVLILTPEVDPRAVVEAMPMRTDALRPPVGERAVHPGAQVERADEKRLVQDDEGPQGLVTPA